LVRGYAFKNPHHKKIEKGREEKEREMPEPEEIRERSRGKKTGQSQVCVCHWVLEVSPTSYRVEGKPKGLRMV